LHSPQQLLVTQPSVGTISRTW